MKLTLRETARRRAPGLLRAYRRWLAPVVARDRRHPRFSRWARRGAALREEFGTTAISFESDGVWVRDREGLEWAYEPGAWLSALGKELGFDYDPDEIDYVRSALPGGGAFVDVGSHVGGYLLPVAATNDGAEIHAFEPVPQTRAVLERNLARNGLSGAVTVWPYAVGDAPGIVSITTYSEGGDNRVLEDGVAPPAESIRVEAVTLDEFLTDRCKRVDVIKCDIEGAELPALRGAEGILRRDQPEVLVEVDPRFDDRFDGGAERLVEFMAGLGYGARLFAGGKLRDVADLESGTNNVLFSPKEGR